MKSPIRIMPGVLIVLISSFPNLAAQGTRLFRPEDIFQVRRVGATVWAGDGRYAAIEFSRASRWLDGVPANEISLLDVRTRSLRQLSPRSTAYLGFFNAAWSPDSKRVAFLSVADTGFVDRKVTVNGAEYRYQVYVPAEFNRSRKWPVIVFLHDNGGRGVDGRSQTNAGLASIIRRDRARVPAIVVFPQANPSSRWSSPVMQEQILASLDATAREFNGDADRFYLIGYSMGGQGVLRLASRWPNRFAALVDVSGTVIAKSPSATNEQVALDLQTHPFLTAPDLYQALAQVIAAAPIWIFHGDADESVPVEQSRQLVSALKSAGAQVRYTEYAGAGHSIEERALSEPELLTWLLAQTRKPKKHHSSRASQ